PGRHRNTAARARTGAAGSPRGRPRQTRPPGQDAGRDTVRIARTAPPASSNHPCRPATVESLQALRACHELHLEETLSSQTFTIDVGGSPMPTYLSRPDGASAR